LKTLKRYQNKPKKFGDKKTSITYEIGKENGRFTKGGKKGIK